jgi:hypothetical protein
MADTVQPGVIYAEKARRKGCAELDLPSHDAFSSEGANACCQAAYMRDPVRGALYLKRVPCRVKTLLAGECTASVD